VGEEMRLEEMCSDLVMIPRQDLARLTLLKETLDPIEKVWMDLGHTSWVVTNGYRFMKEHVAIYNRINAQRKKEKKKLLAIPLGSQHLKGNAVDIYDPRQDLKLFIAQYLHLFEEAGIYFEAFNYCPSWVHMQQVPPKSLNRFFQPY
jgi:hypothetical protein